MIQVLVCGTILPFTLFNTGSLFGLLALKFVQALVVCSAFIQKDPKQTFPYLTGPEHPTIELSDGQQDVIGIRHSMIQTLIPHLSFTNVSVYFPQIIVPQTPSTRLFLLSTHLGTCSM